MIYTNIITLYISGERNQRLVRYDVIPKANNDYIVKVIDEQTKGIADPKVLVEVDEFEVTQQNYRTEQSIGGIKRAITYDLPLSFEGYLNLKLQDHRNKLD